MRLMVVGCDDTFVEDLVIKIDNRNDIDVAYVTTYYPEKLKSRLSGTNITVLDSREFSFPDRILKLFSGDIVVSEKLLKDMCETENDFLTNSDRFTFHRLSVRERKRLYIALLRFWINFLSTANVDALFFEATPHMCWDNILYDLARPMKIQTPILMRTLLQDRVFLLDDFREVKKVPVTWEVSLSIEEIISRIDNNLYQLLKKESVWIQYSKEINDRVKVKRSIIPSLRKGFIKLIRKRKPAVPRLRKFINSIFNISRPNLVSALFFNGSEFTRFGILIRRLIVNRKLSRLRRYYTSLCCPLNVTQPYVYFALNFQPERSTMPEGGVFENQLLAVRLLAKTIPSGYTLYIKEHPRQFDHHRLSLAKRHFRSFEEYRELAEIPNVKLLDIRESGDRLVEHAYAVATISGSVGWEAMLKGVPAIVFGRPWYTGCESCHVVSSESECTDAFLRIREKSQEETKKDILRYLCYFQNSFIVSSNAYRFAKASKINYNLLVENLAEALVNCIRM